MIIAMILGLSAVLRLWGLGANPPSLYWEEVALGYDSYSLWETGRDFHGNPWPLIAFESFGDWKPSGYFYFLAPFTGLLGLKEWVVRLPSSLAGIATVGLVYLLVSEYYDKRMARWSALGLAISPWHIHVSRVGFEINLGLMFFTLGLVFWAKARRGGGYLLGTAFAWLFASYTYHAYRLLVPMAGALMYWHSRRWWRGRQIRWLLGFGLMMAVGFYPLIINLNNSSVSQRYREVSYLNISPAVMVTNQWREKLGNSIIVRGIFHRYWFWAAEVARNALSHFRYDFLFERGDGNWRHQDVNFGLFYGWYGLMFLLGLLPAKKTKRLIWLPLSLMVMPSIPAALSTPTPHALRFFPATIGFACLFGLGLSHLLLWFKQYQRILEGLVLGMVIASLISFLIDYWGDYRVKAAAEWQYGYKEAIEYVVKQASFEDRILFTRNYGRPSMYVFFYLKIDPRLVQAINKTVDKDQGEYLEFGQWSFSTRKDMVYDWRIESTPQQFDNYELVKVINNLLPAPVYYIYRKI